MACAITSGLCADKGEREEKLKEKERETKERERDTVGTKSLVTTSVVKVGG